MPTEQIASPTFSRSRQPASTALSALDVAASGGKWWVLKSLKEPFLADPAYTGLLHKEADILSVGPR